MLTKIDMVVGKYVEVGTTTFDEQIMADLFKYNLKGLWLKC
jgi:hypothetical protein